MIEEFSAAWLREADERGPELLPESLARAAAAVLAVDGAGLSIISQPALRLPIGASDDAAATAERWQFTLGDGPCFRAHDTQQVVVAAPEVFADQWPVLQAEIDRHAGFGSVVCIPLGGSFAGFGVLDLYFRQLRGAGDFDARGAVTVATAISDVLLAASPASEAPTPREATAEISWLNAPQATRRRRVWIALGMVNLELRMSTTDALAVLRARAYSSGRLVEDVADDMVAGRLLARQLLSDASS